jgi:RNA 2',3'-cyclic 3'-phosphodiesterase
MEQIRAFIAIELPKEIKKELSVVQSKLNTPSKDYIKWVDPDGIHLTLKFLGKVAEDKVKDIIEAMTVSVQGIRPFNLSLKGLGVFPNANRTQVAWVGLTGELSQLSKLHKQLEAELEKLGFAVEKRRFSPHITLARLRNQASPIERQALGKLIGETGFISDKVIKVTAINLLKSQLTRSGAIYSRLATVHITVVIARYPLV